MCPGKDYLVGGVETGIASLTDAKVASYTSSAMSAAARVLGLEALGHEVIVADPNFAPCMPRGPTRSRPTGAMPAPTPAS
jgi:hypothetical protein